MSEWQDISTAPKDGTGILGYWGTVPDFVGNPWASYCVVQFVDGEWRDADDEEKRYAEPHFWMPLPPAPEAAKE